MCQEEESDDDEDDHTDADADAADGDGDVSDIEWTVVIQSTAAPLRFA